MASGIQTGVQWCKVASNLDSHPKIRRAGRNGREVFLFALRRNAEPGNQFPGSVAFDTMAPWYLADQLQMPESDAVDGLARCELAGLLVRGENVWLIVGWRDDEWGRNSKAVPGKVRTHEWRERKEANAVTQSVTADVTARDVGDDTNVTRHDGDARDARDDIRVEKSREEEKRENNDAPLALFSGSPILQTFKAKVDRVRAAKPKPNEATHAELASVREILSRLGAHNGVAYSDSKAHVALIVARLREGVTEMDMRSIVAYAVDPKGLGWLSDDKMRKHLCPETLFGPKTHSKYLEPARAWVAKKFPNGVTQAPQLQLAQSSVKRTILLEGRVLEVDDGPN